ncbi:hypothetical protein WJX73_001642 [Symbiochloris irregularis]|uniref:Limiting CO2-inducible protein B/C beta carbonyic anhydrase domain-containing protein n=1 Tax=Symbiochloris irregularis TaxID=706552 RepID=A0AAW1PR61_9CHLO
MRTKHVTDQFPNALGVDDFLSRVEIALFELGFDGANSIAMTNLCRDEVTAVLKTKIEEIFGASFNTNGLGGVLTCGVIGVKAGLSHSPQCKAGKDRYVFFSFPHIAIDSRGTVGNISRPGRPGPSAACGALKGAQGLLANGISANESKPGVHDESDPEFSIFKQRLVNRLKHEGVSEDAAKKIDLVELTKVAERAITADLEALISKAVDSSSADYAVVTGVQIHNWSDADFNDQQPTMEFIYPSTIYAVIDGQPKSINLTGFPGLTPRQINILAAGGTSAAGPHADFEPVCGVTTGNTTVRAVDVPYSHNDRSQRAGTSRNAKFYESELAGRK